MLADLGMLRVEVTGLRARAEALCREQDRALRTYQQLANRLFDLEVEIKQAIEASRLAARSR
jgi:hypothetical protein